MKKEINTLKKKYTSIAPPDLFETSGMEDLWIRIDKKQYAPFFYFPGVIITIILAFILTSGLIGIASASAKKGSLLYPVKIASQNVISSASRMLPSKVNRFFVPAAKLTPTGNPALKQDEQDNKEEDKTVQDDSSDKKNEILERNEENSSIDNSRDIKGENVEQGSKNQENSSDRDGENEKENNGIQKAEEATLR